MRRFWTTLCTCLKMHLFVTCIKLSEICCFCGTVSRVFVRLSVRMFIFTSVCNLITLRVWPWRCDTRWPCLGTWYFTYTSFIFLSFVLQILVGEINCKYLRNKNHLNEFHSLYDHDVCGQHIVHCVTRWELRSLTFHRLFFTGVKNHVYTNFKSQYSYDRFIQKCDGERIDLLRKKSLGETFLEIKALCF